MMECAEMQSDENAKEWERSIRAASNPDAPSPDELRLTLRDAREALLTAVGIFVFIFGAGSLAVYFCGGQQ